ncbi:MAG: hypothetical protein II951_01470 [Bacteroidales bacterium]|nr:hypothetical protein [Bacteroidales bacterium]
MSYRCYNTLEAIVLLDGEPAGATVHDRYYDDACPNVCDRLFFDKVVPDDGKPHVLKFQVSLIGLGKKVKHFVKRHEAGRFYHFVFNDAVDFNGRVVQNGSIRLCVGVLSCHDDYDVKAYDDGIAYIIRPTTRQRRFFFSTCYGVGNRVPQKSEYVVGSDVTTIDVAAADDHHFRLIGANRRFGNGYVTVKKRRRYYAFYGFPDRNDDYFYSAEITENEFYEIERTFDCVSRDGNTGPCLDYYEKYIKGRHILTEGWTRVTPGPADFPSRPLK